MSDEVLSELDVLLERSDYRPIIKQFIAQPGAGIWVRGRSFDFCVLEHRFEFHGSTMSVTRLRRTLNSLIFKGYVTRLRWRQVTALNDNEVRLDRLSREDPRDYYNDDKEYWEYLPTPKLWSAVAAQPKEKMSLFAS